MAMTPAELEQKQTVIYEVDGSEVKLSPTIVKKFLVGEGNDITDQEYKFFVELCKVRKLNPFLKEVHLIKFGKQPAQIVVGKDAILKRAIIHPKFNGREQGIIVLTDKGEIVERKGTFKLTTDTLVGGWAKVYRKDWDYPTYITVNFDEVKQEKNVFEDKVFKGKELNSNWATKGATMVEKVALVRALRESFVEELGGMIDADEAWEQPKHQQRANNEEVIEQEEIVIDESKVIDIDNV